MKGVDIMKLKRASAGIQNSLIELDFSLDFGGIMGSEGGGSNSFSSYEGPGDGHGYGYSSDEEDGNDSSDWVFNL